MVPALNVANLTVLSFLANQLRGRENHQMVKNGSCVVIYSRNLLKMAAAKNDYNLPNLTGLKSTSLNIFATGCEPDALPVFCYEASINDHQL